MKSGLVLLFSICSSVLAIADTADSGDLPLTIKCDSKIFVTAGVRMTKNPKSVITQWDPRTGEENNVLFAPFVRCAFRSINGEIAFTQRVDDGYVGLMPKCLDRLHVIDCRGKARRLTEARFVDCVSWSPDGNSIAYIKYVGTTSGGTTPEGAFLFDTANGKEEKILEDAYDLHWALFDSCIYVADYFDSYERVQKYDPATKRLVKTPYQSVRFSPDGRYYFEYYREDSKPSCIRLRSTNEDISNKEDCRIDRLVLLRLGLDFWLDERFAAMSPTSGLYTRDKGPWYILNLETGEVHRSDNRVFESYDADRVIIFDTKQDKFALESISKMPIVKPEDLPRSPFMNLEPKESVY